MDIKQCPCWTAPEEAQAEEHDVTTDGIVLPWSGSALGLVDLGFVAGGAKPLVVGIAGPQAAGKTTLLAAWYLLLGRGQATTGSRRFAGSYSIAGWEAIAGSLRWSPGQAAAFPPHTTSRGGRVPGLLHLAFREADGRLRAYLLADAPGEWFQKWAVNRDAPDGEGARWVADHADVFLLVADREALSGPTMGTARGAFQNLARRLGTECRERPVALVWTKADVEIAPEMEKAVRDTVMATIPDATEFFVSVISGPGGPTDIGRGLVELFDWMLSARRAPAALLPPDDKSDPLFVLGAP
ncbi:GTPase domain-containing protein (plasmid) [Skermanella mucosa]|uniref:TRAFAC clade GTPase domain-containing protein n=1 Tax=Skermanella mucosa TaxID=1789672 RepID=UPI00192CBB21|nr:GTPase domain-containing protein [Skermanella mucosa]UEM24362.1 GTPase domain-containing protein [Skermanella mucosa]